MNPLTPDQILEQAKLAASAWGKNHQWWINQRNAQTNDDSKESDIITKMS